MPFLLKRPNRSTKRMRQGIHNEVMRVKAEHDARRAAEGFQPAREPSAELYQPDLLTEPCEFCLPEVPCPLHFD